MSFTGATIREPDDGQDDRLYPSVRPDGSGAVYTAEDGHDIDLLVANQLEILTFDDKARRQAAVEDVRIELAVTDARIIFSCAKYEKGGGWRGGLTAMAVLNTASKIRASVRSKGKCLVGHVRYPWLTTIGHRSKSGLINTEEIRLCVQDKTSGEPTSMGIDLLLPKDVSAWKVADEIARRTARFRLDAHPELSEEDRRELERIATEGVDPGNGDGSNFTMHKVPGAKYVLLSTASYTGEPSQ